ncbi:MAG: DUF5104 domain-containing protein [Mobilitalea sp.]
MKISKSIYIILICSIFLFLQGCSFLQYRLNLLELEVNRAKKYQLELTNNVLNCFNEKDTDTLKTLLCSKTQGLTDIDEQIQTCFDLFKGKVISFDDNLMGYEGESIESGHTTRLERAWNVKDIVTDEDKKYEIYIYTYVINENDKDKEGISDITVTCSDGTEYKIGYRWPSYYTEGSELSYKVITAFGENDIAGLKFLFCNRTLDIADINEQIQTGIDFFDGKATMGMVDNESIVYDGDHDYTTTVSDEEIVKNNEPTRTSISVFNENIETDSGKIYSLEFYATLLSSDDNSVEGISQITITDEAGTKQVIGERIN